MRRAWLLGIGVSLLAVGSACSSSTPTAVGSAPQGGSAGIAGSSGGAGNAGTSGNAGNAGSNGSAGASAGSAGMTGVAPGSPIVFYTDLASAPAGAYVTLFGRGFGSAGAAASITLSGSACTTLSWSDTQIELQLPSDAVGGALVVHTSAGDAPAQALGVHTGKLYFVASDGDDSWSGTKEQAQSGDGPFKTLARGRDALAAGDVLYLRGGTFSALDNFNAVLSLYDVPTGTIQQPIAIVSYPGEPATFGDGTLARGISLYRGDNGPQLAYLTIAKLKFRPTCDAIEIIGSDHGRFVANEISGASDACENGTIETQGTSYWQLLGNSIHDNGNTKLEHGIYLGGYGNQHDWEIAYNRIGPQTGGRGIQLYGHTPMDRIETVSIHDNEIFSIDRDGIVLGATDADVLTLTNISIYNNLFHQAGRCVGAGVRVGNTTASGISVFHNTFYDNGAGNMACDQSTGQLGSQVLIENALELQLSNNILVATGSEPYVALDVMPATFDGSHNVFFGGSAAPSWDAAAITGDPGFLAAPSANFHLPAASPAAGKGTPLGISVDHDGIARPSATPTPGAYEPLP